MSTGSVYQRKDGYWVAAVQVDGKRRVKYAKTKRAAQEKLSELQRDLLLRGSVAQPGTRTLDDLLDLWLSTAELRPTTLAHYQAALDKHVRPQIGALRLSHLKPADLQALYTTIDGPRLPAKIHRMLHRALKLAVQWGWLTSNPAERVVAPTYKPPRREMWTQDQLHTFLEGIRGHRHEAFWLLALASGLRISELLGLQWGDIDLDASVLTVRRARVTQAGTTAILPPKTRAGERSITLPQQAVDALPTPGRPEEWIFTNDDGAPLPHSSVQKSLKRVCDKLRLPSIGTHGLRHMHATLLLSQGLPVPAVSARLGHANPHITMTTYAHALPQQDKAAAELISTALELVSD